jgi:subtilisin family serine protease
MRRSRALFVCLAGALMVAASARGSQAAIAKADPALLRAMESGRGEMRVIVGLRDGTTSPRLLRERPDPAGEPDRRARRLAAQQRLASQVSSEQFRSPGYYESFSMLSGIASPQGVRALAAHPDVEWLALDEERHLESSAPTSLIRSDAANALGFRGSGATVAVLDSGVDQSVAELGGGSFPNAKVVGGINLLEPGSPPFDCFGHGTSVASIVAGSQSGVAPDAKIVAVKLSGGCDALLFDSVILRGLDFAISNRAKFGITALNMSLGGSPTGDASTVGFCDSLQPQFASSIDAATAAGIVVTVASGNSATSNQISSPACISSAVSVGAVYPLSSSGVDWGLCSDTAIVPGTPTCFSNSNTNLTLLAPGAFWNVPTDGGAIVSFSGTSAAAPAVAGVVALVRAARPSLSPSTTVSLLRATGRPIVDQRNNVVTPLVDALAAVQFAPSTFGTLESLPIAIPDGTGSAIATATVSGFSGYLVGVEVWVEIDHPDPRQLRLTLTGPDGTSVILHDQSGTPESPINTIFGRTGASLFPLSAFRGKPANGVWTLTVQDLVPGASGRILHFSVTPVAGVQVPPIEAIPLNVNAVVLPVVARTTGTKFFQTDARYYNPTSVAKELDLHFVGTAMTGATSLKTTRTVAPGQVLALNDVVLSEFGQADSFGELTAFTAAVSGDTNFLAASRTYTRGVNGTFGFSAPGFKTATGLVLFGGTATTNGLGKTPTSHSNVGFTEVSGFPVTVRIDIRDGNGTLVGSTSRTAQPNTTLLVTDIVKDRGLPSQPNLRADFTVVSPTGKAIPFATTVDEVTGDSIFHAPLMPALTTDDVIVAQTSHVPGLNGEFFQTTVNITNLDAFPATVTVSLLPLLLEPGSLTSRVYVIQPGQTLEFLDVLSSTWRGQPRQVCAFILWEPRG